MAILLIVPGIQLKLSSANHDSRRTDSTSLQGPKLTPRPGFLLDLGFTPSIYSFNYIINTHSFVVSRPCIPICKNIPLTKMAKPKLNVFLDVVSPFAYMAFYVTKVDTPPPTSLHTRLSSNR